ncbi:uracil-DNA glycosylase [bacterium]|jgi:DNA polymerase|nr:uracil-DNA glycosylase [bacterium]|tara:strand:+ start:213 stop:785 length:573 start_codon:yes stop_codon:yes gene_type:complete
MRTPAEGCTKCSLSNHRQNIVWHRGNPFGAIVLIGEAPGADEDATGKAFVGRAGKKLDEILMKAKAYNANVPIAPEEVLIVNTVKCRPPENRVPTEDEMTKCRPYLQSQLELSNPHIIVLLGKTSADALLGGKSSLGDYRGSVHQCEIGSVVAPAVVTYHPAALLRNPKWGAEVVKDFKEVIRLWKDLNG